MIFPEGTAPPLLFLQYQAGHHTAIASTMSSQGMGITAAGILNVFFKSIIYARPVILDST